MSIVIFGGTGSLGTALIKRFSHVGEDIIVVSRDEQKHFRLKEQFPSVTFLLGDVRSKDDLRVAFRDTNTPVELVINAAALKHVSIGEYNPYQSIQTNILGAKNVIDVCCEFEVPTCIFVSTDKAVQPVNLYGMCKATAERLYIQANKRGITKFNGVRYGNVLDSNGSLLPFLRDRGKAGQSLYLTDTRMTRFFITLVEATELIDNARADSAERGTITIPRMRSAAIQDILFLYSEHYGVGVNIIGMKPGEKLHEILLSETEFDRTYECDDVYRLFDPALHTPEITKELYKPEQKIQFKTYSSNDPERIMDRWYLKELLEKENLL